MQAITPSPTFEDASIGAGDARRVRTTMMFTDIVASTVLLSAMGDERWLDVLRWHDAVLRRRFAERAGREVKQVGDGFFAVFDDACLALACAMDIQRTVARVGDVCNISLRIRIGVHRADVIETGGDYVGRGVHEAARIAARARGGEILTSVETLADSWYAFNTLRRHRLALRGLPDPVTVVSIRHQCAGGPPLDRHAAHPWRA